MSEQQTPPTCQVYGCDKPVVYVEIRPGLAMIEEGWMQNVPTRCQRYCQEHRPRYGQDRHMTKQPDLDLDAIDRLVAEKVMGWHLESRLADGQPTGWGLYIPPTMIWWVDDQGAPQVTDWHPTRDRAQAMMVFERCDGMTVEHVSEAYQAHDQPWQDCGEGYEYFAQADTPMLAICLAALKRAGVGI